MCGRQKEFSTGTMAYHTNVHQDSQMVCRQCDAANVCDENYYLESSRCESSWSDLFSCASRRRTPRSQPLRVRQLQLVADNDLDSKMCVVAPGMCVNYGAMSDGKVQSTDGDSEVYHGGVNKENLELKVALRETQEKLDKTTREFAVVAGLSVEDARAHLEKSALPSSMSRSSMSTQDTVEKSQKENAVPPSNFMEPKSNALSAPLKFSPPFTALSSEQQQTRSGTVKSRSLGDEGRETNSPTKDLAKLGKLRVGHWEYPMSREEKKFLAFIAEHEVAASVCRELAQVRKEKTDLAYKLQSAKAALSSSERQSGRA